MMSGLITALLVTARIAATNWANVVQKRLLKPGSHTPLSLFAAVWGWMTLLTLPWWMTALGSSGVFWGWMLLTCLLEVPGNVLLLRSLQQTELSIFGPLSSFKPVVSLLVAFLLFGEQTNIAGLVGVAIVLLGTLWLTAEPRTESTRIAPAARRAGIRDRLLAVVLTAVASVFLKQAMVGKAELEVLAVWCLLSWLLVVLWQVAIAYFSGPMTMSSGQTAHPQPMMLAMRLRVLFKRLRLSASLVEPRRRGIFLIAVAMLVMQACTISLFARMPVGYALALFQIGSLVSVVIGHRLFGEAHLIRRLLAAGVMIIGAVVIIVLG